MNRHRVDKAKASQMSITSYSTIAQSILKMDRALKAKMTRKFEICYAMAKEKIAFRKYPTLHDLEAHHGVDLGTSYKTKDSAKNFTHYITSAVFSVFASNKFLQFHSRRFNGCRPN